MDKSDHVCTFLKTTIAIADLVESVNENHDKIVAIDIETGDFEVDVSEIVACDRLEALHPINSVSLP